MVFDSLLSVWPFEEYWKDLKQRMQGDVVLTKNHQVGLKRQGSSCRLIGSQRKSKEICEAGLKNFTDLDFNLESFLSNRVQIQVNFMGVRFDVSLQRNKAIFLSQRRYRSRCLMMIANYGLSKSGPTQILVITILQPWKNWSLTSIELLISAFRRQTVDV